MALTLVTSDLIHGLDYSKLTGTIPTWNQNTTGNAATATLAAGATILATARNIGGVSFNGSAAIDLPGVNTAGNQNTSGNAGTVTNGVYTVGNQTIAGAKTFSDSGTFIKTSSSNSTTPLVVRNSGSTAIGTESKIFLSTVAGDDRGAYISSIITDSSNGNALILATNAAGASPAERMRISSGGDVKIGTADGLPLMHGSVAGNSSYCTYSFVNDPNTGMIRTGADTLALVTAGSPRLTISSGGAATFGGDVTMNSSSIPLTINGTSANGGYAAFQRSGVNYALIGNATSVTGGNQDDLAIQATNSLRLQTGGNNTRLFITSVGVTKIYAQDPFALRVIAKDTVGDAAIGFYRSGESYRKANIGFINGTDDTFYLGNRENAPMLFHTNDTERIRILANGNVGIGTTSPVGLGGSAKALVVTATSNYPEVIVERLSTGAGKWGMLIGNDGTLLFRNYVSGGNVLCISNSDKVGIGTSSPATELQIGDYTDATQAITIATTQNGTGRINFYDNNDTEGGVIKVTGKSGGSTMTFAGRWNVDNTKVTFDLVNGNVGIGNSSPSAKLDVRGAVAAGRATEDGGVTVSLTGGSDVSGGTLEMTQGWTGTMSSGDTVVFTYNAVSWKSWILQYKFASTNGLTSGEIGGYNNNSDGNSNTTHINSHGMSIGKSRVGQSNIITFTFTSLGVHPFCHFKYYQSGGDGAPTAAKASITLNS